MTILDLAQQAGINPKWVAGTGGGEYHSACPECGGTDRFFIQPFRQMRNCLGSYCCRQCGVQGDAIQFARQFLHYSFQEAAEAVNATINERITLPNTHLRSFKPTVLKSPTKEWIQRATAFIDGAHTQLLGNSDVLKNLSKRGLSAEAIGQYKFGWIDRDMFFDREHWGLEPQLDQNGKPRLLWIPKGIVIPVIESDGPVRRLKIRRSDWHPEDTLPKYVAITGSMNGLSIIGNISNHVMLVVESELDAFAAHYAGADHIFVVAVGGSSKTPDNVTDRHARQKKLLICHDNDSAGQKMLAKWQSLYPHAQAYSVPIGKDIGEAIKMGFDVKQWIINTISKD